MAFTVYMAAKSAGVKTGGVCEGCGRKEFTEGRILAPIKVDVVVVVVRVVVVRGWVVEDWCRAALEEGLGQDGEWGSACPSSSSRKETTVPSRCEATGVQSWW